MIRNTKHQALSLYYINPLEALGMSSRYLPLLFTMISTCINQARKKQLWVPHRHTIEQQYLHFFNKLAHQHPVTQQVSS